jgi:hypothetical protein
MMIRIAVRFFAGLVLLLSAFPLQVRAQSRYDAIWVYDCEPANCYSDIGPTTTGDTFTTVEAECNNGNHLGTLVGAIYIVGQCKHPLILGTSGAGQNILEIEDNGCGGFIDYYLGEISVNIQALDVVTGATLLNSSRYQDCIGGLTAPLRQLGPC